MLKITVSIIPGGIGSERKLGEMLIGNVGGAEYANYNCVLTGSDLPEPMRASIRRYPRWSASVWDLVARALAKTLFGTERLSRRPALIDVPLHEDDGVCYVRIAEIPEPVRSIFERRMLGSTTPVIDGESDCVYASDWLSFLRGGR